MRSSAVCPGTRNYRCGNGCTVLEPNPQWYRQYSIAGCDASDRVSGREFNKKKIIGKNSKSKLSSVCTGEERK